MSLQAGTVQTFQLGSILEISSLEEPSLPSQIIKMSKGFEPRVVFFPPVVFCRDRRERKDEENWKSISETSITFQIS